MNLQLWIMPFNLIRNLELSTPVPQSLCGCGGRDFVFANADTPLHVATRAATIRTRAMRRIDLMFMIGKRIGIYRRI